MKKLLLVLFISLSGLLQACNNKAEEDIPAAVRTSFDSKFPGSTDVEWKQGSEDNQVVYKAEFKHNGQDMKASFDGTGSLIKAGKN
jgi:hypothetical protein